MERLESRSNPEILKGLSILNGADIAKIKRFEDGYSKYGERFLEKIFTENEIVRLGRLKNKAKLIEEIAGRFAGKEAVSKILGTGISQFGSKATEGVHWKDIEINNEPSGKPVVELYGKAKEKSKKLGIFSMSISLTHDGDMAFAVAAALSYSPSK